MAVVQERYRGRLLAANTVLPLFSQQDAIGFFLCSASGNLQITNCIGVTVVNVPVTAGVYLPLPINLFDDTVVGTQAVVTLSGGAAGTLGV